MERRNHDHRLKPIFLLLLTLIFSSIKNQSFLVLANDPNSTWVGSKYQIECTMCSSCDNPCNTPSTLPPPPPPPTPPAASISPPPPYPPSSSGGNNYNPPTSTTPYSYYPPPQMYPGGPAPPPPNPIVPYFPYYFHNPPPSSSPPPSKKIPLTFLATAGILFLLIK